MINIVHTCNNYLNFNLKNIDNLEKRRKDFQFAFNSVVKFVMSKNVDLFIISGVFFDKGKFDDQIIEDLKKQCENQLKNVKIIIFDYSRYCNRLFHEKSLKDIFQDLENVTVYDNSKEEFTPYEMKIKDTEIELYFHNENSNLSFVDYLKSEKRSEKFSLFLSNCKNTPFSTFLNDVLYLDDENSDIKNYSRFYENFFSKNFNYVGVAYSNIFAKKKVNNSIVCCPGSSEKYNYKDFKDEKGYVNFSDSIITIDHIKFKKIKTRKIDVIDINISQKMDILSQINAKIKSYNKKNNVVNIVLRGKTTFENYYDFKLNDKINESLKGKCFYSILTDLLTIHDDSPIFTNFKFFKPKKMFEKHLDDKLLNSDDDSSEKLKKIKEIGLDVL